MTDIEDLLAQPYSRLPLVHDDTNRLPDATMQAIREDVVAGTELPTFLAAEAADESSPFRAELNSTIAEGTQALIDDADIPGQVEAGITGSSTVTAAVQAAAGPAVGAEVAARKLIEGVDSPAASGGVTDVVGWASETTTPVTGNVLGTVLDRWEGRRNPAASRQARRVLTVTSQAEFDAAWATIAAQLTFGWWWDIIMTPGLTVTARELVLPGKPSKVRLICPVRGGATIMLDNPDGSGAAITNIQSPLWPIWDCEIIGVKVTAHNGRYALHHDQDGTNVDTTQLTEDCFFEHLGNSDSSSGVWRTPPAWGSGVASGQRTVHRRTVFRSAGEHPYAVHSNRPYTRPAVVRMEDCVLEVAAYGNSGDGRAILLASLGSQVTCRLDISGTRFRGLHYIEHVTAPWRATDGSAPHVEWDVRLSGSDTIG